MTTMTAIVADCSDCGDRICVIDGQTQQCPKCREIQRLRQQHAYFCALLAHDYAIEDGLRWLDNLIAETKSRATVDFLKKLRHDLSEAQKNRPHDK